MTTKTFDALTMAQRGVGEVTLGWWKNLTGAHEESTAANTQCVEGMREFVAQQYPLKILFEAQVGMEITKVILQERFPEIKG